MSQHRSTRKSTHHESTRDMTEHPSPVPTKTVAPQPAAGWRSPRPRTMRATRRAGQRRDCRAVPRLPASHMRTSGAVIRLRHGGSGPPLLLLHGNPQNHVCWYKVAARLAQHYHVVLPDLRGYGDSSLPASRPQQHQLQLPSHGPGHGGGDGATRPPPYFAAGHDRGARTRTACASTMRSA